MHAGEATDVPCARAASIRGRGRGRFYRPQAGFAGEGCPLGVSRDFFDLVASMGVGGPAGTANREIRTAIARCTRDKRGAIDRPYRGQSERQTYHVLAQRTPGQEVRVPFTSRRPGWWIRDVPWSFCGPSCNHVASESAGAASKERRTTIAWHTRAKREAGHRPNRVHAGEAADVPRARAASIRRRSEGRFHRPQAGSAGERCPPGVSFVLAQRASEEPAAGQVGGW